MHDTTQPIKIAILAMGGEGGGVLADWIVDLAETNGYFAQTTSVPGVAQRTGATIYYLELFSQTQAQADKGQPVFALMPLVGDVDVVLASELMEAGRAIQRGLVSKAQTTLIASTHRVFSVAEKSALGDGRVDSQELLAHAHQAAQRFIRFDMEKAAQACGSVVSAVLFGTLAGSHVLPFTRAQFEATIERGGVGIRPSLKAFEQGYQHAQGNTSPPTDEAVQAPVLQPQHAGVRALLARIAQEFPASMHTVLREGVRRLVDYQDLGYADLYLDRMSTITQSTASSDGLLRTETGRHLALWMSYEDTARVAALKTRHTRFERVHQEAGVQADQVLAIHEYMHPRLQEICETLPAPLGRWLMNSHLPRRMVEHWTQKGRVIQTSSVRGYLLLRTVAAMKRFRRSTLRYAEENRRIEAWLGRIEAIGGHNPALALEVAYCQRLVKGYSDTHERGIRHYDLVMQALDQSAGSFSPTTLRELREAALADDVGHVLRDALARHALANS